MIRRPPKYRPGDNLMVCDISGIIMYQSDSVTTWDGLRVHQDYYDPRHPQLDVRGVPETSQRVIDGRPEQPATFTYATYGTGPLTLGSLDGIFYNVVVDNAGTISTVLQPFQPLAKPGYVNGYELIVDNAGAITTEALEAGDLGPSAWLLVSPNGTTWKMTVPLGVVTTTVFT